MRNHRRQSAFTLIELMVAMAIGLFLVATGFMLLTDQTRLSSATQKSLDLDFTLRSTNSLMVRDLQLAGAGVGYRPDGTFAGLETREFDAGGLRFYPTGMALGANRTTDDVGIRYADGGYATIAEFAGGVGKICRNERVRAGTTAILLSEDYLSAQAVRLDSVADTDCGRNACVGGCASFEWTLDSIYSSDPGASALSYENGEMASGFVFVVWFVHQDGSGETELRRAEMTTENPCSVRDSSCGVLVSSAVETVQMRVHQWSGSGWNDVTGTAVAGDGALRVDIELVARARSEGDRTYEPVALALEPGECLPDCTDRDRLQRRALRTSVDIRNSGRPLGLR